METFLKSVSLGFLLRNVLAGAFFVITYSIATKGTCAAISVNSGNIFSFGLGFALLAGITIYGIHRSVIFPWIEWFLNSTCTRKLRKDCLPLISRNTIKDILRRWDSRAEKDKLISNRAGHITTWADYVHSQYVSAWCICMGAAAGMIVSGRYSLPHWGWIVGFTIFFCFAASVSAWRARSVEDWMQGRDQSFCPKTPDPAQ
jgi:hypothetical protein